MLSVPFCILPGQAWPGYNVEPNDLLQFEFFPILQYTPLFYQPSGGAMRSLILSGILILSLIFGILPAFATPGDILQAFPLPTEHATGLTYDGKHFWVADRLTDSLYALNPKNGAVVRQLPSPGFIPRGLAWDGKYLWCVDQNEQRILQLDTKTGETIHSVESPTSSIQGITWDDGTLWIVDDRADVLCQISPTDGTTIEEFRAPNGHSTGLTMWRDYLLCGDRTENRIYLIDPKHDGEVIYSLPAPGEYVRGLTTIKETLWAVDFQTDSLYAIEVEGNDWIRTSDRHPLELTLIHEFINYGPGDVTSADIHIAVPRTLPSQNILEGPTFTPEPDEIIEDNWHQKVAVFHPSSTDLSERTRIQMRVAVELSAVEWYVLPDKVGTLDEIPGDIADMYLADGDKFRIHDPRIQNAVREAIGDETNPYWMMRGIHKFIRERLHYELSGGWNVAPRVLERGNGSCSEYTFAFIAMCRAAGIPARYVGAVSNRGDEASTDDVFHRWSQVYFPGYGWIHVDPQGGDKSKPADIAGFIGHIANRYLITTEGGGGSNLLGWSYNYNSNWKAKGPVKVYTEVFGEWQPVVK